VAWSAQRRKKERKKMRKKRKKIIWHILRIYSFTVLGYVVC
jgi:sulfite exporter TauE/SafE